MAGTVFHEHNTSWLGKSIECGAKCRRWACAFVLAFGVGLGLAPEIRAEPPGRLPAGTLTVSEPAPLTSQFVPPRPISQTPVQSSDGPYLFELKGMTPLPKAEELVVPKEDDPLPYSQDQEQQAVPQLSQSMTLDDGTGVRFFANPDPDAPLVGSSVSRRSPVGFVRELNAGVSANEGQFLYNGGLTLAILEREGFGIGGRLLFGGADYEDLDDRQFSYSGDLFTGFRMLTRYGEHWIKGGIFYDWQDHFYKSGPAFAGLFFANEAHPMTLDVALGFGGGDDISFAPVRQEILEVADRDLQVRAGIFLNSAVQVGFSGNFVEFDSPIEYHQEWGVGGFTNLMLGNIRLNLDLTVGEGGVRGFANAAWVFGGPGYAPGRCMVDGQAWLMQPVNRDVALRVRTKGIPPVDGAVGNIGLVTGTIIFPPRLAQGGDVNNNGVIDPGDTFELDLRVTNTSTITATNVSVGQNPTIIGSAANLELDITGENFGDIPPGESRQTDQFSDLNIRVSPTAVAGQTFFVEFDLSADGQTSRVRLGPFVVGGIANGQTYTTGIGQN